MSDLIFNGEVATHEEVEDTLYNAGVDVVIENEILADCVNGTWYSPVTATLTGELSKQFAYEGGSLVYNGDRTAKFLMINTVAITTTGSTVRVEITSGKNGTPCPIGVMPSTTFFGADIAPVTSMCVLDLVNGDTIDFFVRQTSEGGTPDITIEKGRFMLLKIGGSL